MKYAFVVLAAVACVMAQKVPDDMCSVSGEASVSGLGTPSKGEMYRVGDTAKYVIYDEGKTQMIAAIYIRPDLEKTFLMHSLIGKIDAPCIRISEYTATEEEGCFGSEVEDIKGKACFANGKLTKESFEISYTIQSVPQTITVVLDYTQGVVNYQYVHNNEDGEFSCVDMGEKQCDAEAKSFAEGALTFAVCGASSQSSHTSQGGKQVPDSVCSVSGKATIGGLAPVDGYGEMIRVGDTAKYMVYEDNTKSNQLAAIYIRPDNGHTYLMHSQIGSMTVSCVKMSEYAASSEEEGCFELDRGNIKGKACFSDDDRLLNESFVIVYPYGKETRTITVTMSYAAADVNYTYTHDEQDDAFSCVNLTEVTCNPEAETEAEGALTPDVCGTSSQSSQTSQTSQTSQGSQGSQASQGSQGSKGSQGSHGSQGSGSKGSHGSQGSGSKGSHTSSGSGSEASSASFTLPSAILLSFLILAFF